MREKILQIMPAPAHMRAAYIDTDNIDGPLILNRVDFLALVQDGQNGNSVMAMYLDDVNLPTAPHESSNFVAICDDVTPPDAETVSYIREKVREQEAERIESLDKYLREKNAPLATIGNA
jgi:hypothetical protein